MQHHILLAHSYCRLEGEVKEKGSRKSVKATLRVILKTKMIMEEDLIETHAPV